MFRITFSVLIVIFGVLTITSKTANGTDEIDIINTHMEQPRQCLLPKEEGEGDNESLRWFYNVRSRKCEPFIFGGSGGNANNFPSKHRCRTKCYLTENCKCDGSRNSESDETRKSNWYGPRNCTWHYSRNSKWDEPTNYTKNVRWDKGACHGMVGMRVYLIADNGLRIARCHGCAPAVYSEYQEIAALNGQLGEARAIWTLEEGDNNFCAMRGDTGKYLAHCEGCWKGATSPRSVILYTYNQYSQWLMERHGNSFAFKFPTGQYMARCEHGIPEATVENLVFINTELPVDYALWKVVPVDCT